MFFKGLKLKKIGEHAGIEIQRRSELDMTSLIPDKKHEEIIDMMNPVLGTHQILLEAIAALSGYGTIVVEHYSRNYIDESVRVSKFTPSLASSMTFQLARFQSDLCQGNPPYTFRQLASETLGPLTIRYGNCAAIHRPFELDEHWSTCASGLCVMSIFAAIINHELLPEHAMESFDEIPERPLQFMLSIGGMVTKYHNALREYTKQEFTSNGFTEIRNLYHLNA